VNERNGAETSLQGLATEEFFYFFLRLRKGEIRRVVGALRQHHPTEGPEQLAARLIASKTRLALLGGTFATLSGLWPSVGEALQVAGIVGATSMLTRMNLYLVNEIAFAFGEDIDDTARVGDMIAVVAATAVAIAAPGVVGRSLALAPWLQLSTGALSSAAATELIGRLAISHFKRKAGLDVGARPNAANHEAT